MNDKQTFLKSLFDERFDDLLRYCLARLKNDRQAATDVVDDVFFAAEKNAEALAKHPDVKGWLYKTANNLIAHKHRAIKRYARRTVEFDKALIERDIERYSASFDDYEAVFREKDLSEEQIERIKTAVLLRMTVQQRILYNKVYIERKPETDLAKQYGISLDALRMRIYRMEIKLHRLIQEALKNAK